MKIFKLDKCDSKYYGHPCWYEMDSSALAVQKPRIGLRYLNRTIVHEYVKQVKNSNTPEVQQLKCSKSDCIFYSGYFGEDVLDVFTENEIKEINNLFHAYNGFLDKNCMCVLPHYLLSYTCVQRRYPDVGLLLKNPLPITLSVDLIDYDKLKYGDLFSYQNHKHFLNTRHYIPLLLKYLKVRSGIQHIYTRRCFHVNGLIMSKSYRTKLTQELNIDLYNLFNIPPPAQ